MNKKIIIIIIGGLILIGIFILVLFLYRSGGLSESSQKSTTQQKIRKIEGYSGNVLAGEITPFIEFNKEDYDNALADGKIIFLDFYANWCPICRAEEPILYEGFNELSNKNVVGFRVNFNDSDTDQDEEDLAKEFEIPYQYTKVILIDGDVVLIDGNTWDKNKFLEELANL